MRTFKFRVYDKLTKRMITEENVYDVIHTEEAIWDMGRAGEYTRCEPYVGDEWYPVSDIERFRFINYYNENSDRFELMQYTGLKDKNDKEIYEGDIIIGDIPELISSQNLIGIVEYEGSAFIIEFPNRASWQIQKVGFCSFINYKVIGNMYDNPELLEEQTDE